MATTATEPDLAIVIPHRDDPERLSRCLDALAAEPLRGVEIAVVDNAGARPPHPLPEALRGRARVLTERRAGAAHACNRGVAETRAPNLLFLDADCVPRPGWIAAARRAVGSAGLVGGHVGLFDETPGPRSGAEAFEAVFAFDFRRYIERKGFTGTGNMLTARAVFEEVGGFRHGVPEDLDWSRRAAAKGHDIAFRPDMAVLHPSRADWPALRRKWRRLTEEAWGHRTSRGATPAARLLWAGRALLMPASILAHLPRILLSPKLDGLGERRRGALTLARLRLARTGWMLGQAIRPASTHLRSPALARVERGDLCTGCGACAAIAPAAVEMRTVAPGLARPRLLAPLPPGAEDALAAACPGLLQRSAPGHPLWGRLWEVRQGHATDPALRHAAASGGALSAVLTHLIETGAVEGVLHTGPDPADPVGAFTTLSRSAAEIASASGSRYAPSSPLAAIAPHLAAGRPLAFVGRPCDVAALRALAMRDPRVDAAFPWVLSFFCAGVPSRAGAEALMRDMGAEPATTASFRYRGMGWPGRATATARDGTARSMSYEESWGRVLSRHVQNRCRICADGTGTLADLSFGDAWRRGVNGAPVFDEAPGESLIVARTARGAALLGRAESAGALVSRPFDPSGLAAIQPGQVRRRRALLARRAALRLLGRPLPRQPGARRLAAALTGDPLWQARNLLGTLRRALR